ncbi:MAG: hypothetical protein R3C17_10565 [Planctomycetaceae bacterium]
MTLYISNPKPKRTGSWSAGKLQFTEHYDVESTDGTTDPYEVLEFVSSLVINVFHETVLTDIVVDQISEKIWSADCTWKTMTATEKAASPVSGTLPVSRPTVYSFTAREEEAIVSEDIYGTAILNAADDEYNPAPVRRTGSGVLIAKQNYYSFYPINVAAYLYHVNSSAIFGFAPGQVFCSHIGIEENSEIIADVQYDYVTVTFEFEIRSTWTLQILQRGFRAYNDELTEKYNITDDEGNQITEAALLDADGKKLAIDGTPVFGEYVIYPTVDFTTLGLS